MTSTSTRMDIIERKLDAATKIAKHDRHLAKSVQIGDRAGALKSLFGIASTSATLAKSLGEDASTHARDMQDLIRVGKNMNLRTPSTMGFRDEEFSKKRKALLADLNGTQAELTELADEAAGDELLTRHIARLQSNLTEHCSGIGLVRAGDIWRDPHA